VIQVYARKAGARQANDYERVLVGFARSEELGPDASKEVEVQCRLDPVSHWNELSNRFDVDWDKNNVRVSDRGRGFRGI
jgi:hypothetical protein